MNQLIWNCKLCTSAPRVNSDYRLQICMTWRSQLLNLERPLSIEPFWERPTSDPPIRWEKWRIQVNLAILARENITLDTLLQPKPTMVRLPAEPKYKMPIDDATNETERDRQIRNSQLKLQWDLKCQKITEAGVLCGERPWHLCDPKCVSLLYLSISTEGRRLLTKIPS